MFTAGRYEYRNKGIDMFIESLARLNFRLMKQQSKITVVAFIITPAATNSFTIDALKRQAVMKQLQDTVNEIQNRVGKRIFESSTKYTEWVLRLLLYIPLTFDRARITTRSRHRTAQRRATGRGLGRLCAVHSQVHDGQVAHSAGPRCCTEA